MAGLCEGGNEPPGSLKASKQDHARKAEGKQKEALLKEEGRIPAYLPRAEAGRPICQRWLIRKNLDFIRILVRETGPGSMKGWGNDPLASIGLTDATQATCRTWTIIAYVGRAMGLSVPKCTDPFRVQSSFPQRWIGYKSPVLPPHLDWPPRSPDLTTRDNALLGFIKSIVAQGRYETTDELKDAGRRAFRQITPAMLRRMSDSRIVRSSGSSEYMNTSDNKTTYKNRSGSRSIEYEQERKQGGNDSAIQKRISTWEDLSSGWIQLNVSQAANIEQINQPQPVSLPLNMKITGNVKEEKNKDSKKRRRERNKDSKKRGRERNIDSKKRGRERNKDSKKRRRERNKDSKKRRRERNKDSKKRGRERNIDSKKRGRERNKNSKKRGRERNKDSKKRGRERNKDSKKGGRERNIDSKKRGRERNIDSKKRGRERNKDSKKGGKERNIDSKKRGRERNIDSKKRGRERNKDSKKRKRERNKDSKKRGRERNIDSKKRGRERNKDSKKRGRKSNKDSKKRKRERNIDSKKGTRERNIDRKKRGRGRNKDNKKRGRESRE
ncbi:hypothetical protein ANN_04360 [Periplaneta americana]|uniref:Uncharacterized protein n=1 Tax=Periplaneta americana TaxID=6978 RepID=A0ABQ8T8C2_PERAM|nr:hypothetical protein ANN_04360 [Periplaneta americana]